MTAFGWRSSYTADYAADYNPAPDPPGNVNPDFAVTDVTEDNGGYMDHPYGGWSASFKLGDLPDNMRLGTEKVLSQPETNQAKSYTRMDADELKRESVTQNDYSLKSEGSSVSGKQVENSPYRKGWPEPNRPLTMRKNPNTWHFWRPFDSDANGSRVGARRLNGDHFSMADHRRNYEIMGMAPVRTARNTYRIEPPPWDEELIDGPTNSPGYEIPVNYETQGNGSRSYRL